MAFQLNSGYANQASLILQNSFPRISCDAIRAIFLFSESKFTSAYHLLTNIESHRRTIDGDGTGYFEEIPPQIKVFVKQKRPKKTFQLTNQCLCDEVDAIPELNTKEKAQPVVIDLLGLDSEDELDGDDAANAQVPKTECCLCCYGEYPLVEMMECMAGNEHIVCKQCINHYVSEQLDGNDSVTFKCIVDPDCVHGYSNEMLDKDGVLSPRLKGRMNDRVFREVVKRAGAGDEWTCPECAYMGFFDQQYPWIECPVCNVPYCTGCNQIFHDGISCEDARKEKACLQDTKHRAHEAMSQASKRFCPHCNQEYVKSDGCNKIRCNCGKLSCYLCGEKIEDYSHFCEHRPLNCPCGKICKLWTSSEAMEQIDRSRRQAAGRKVLIEAGITDNNDITSILASPPAKDAPVAAIPETHFHRENNPVRNVNGAPDIAPRALNEDPPGIAPRAPNDPPGEIVEIDGEFYILE